MCEKVCMCVCQYEHIDVWMLCMNLCVHCLSAKVCVCRAYENLYVCECMGTYL